tara:strand:+ start:295 stop:978 length:684 start_codon:yes stop_codon:yes gene_type:complete
MIFFLSLIFLFIFFILFVSCKIFIKKKYKGKIRDKLYFFSFLLLIFLLTITTYTFKSNYWLGDSILSKIINSKSVYELNEIDTMLNFIKELEKDIKKNPNDYNKIKKLAETKYLIGNFSEAYILFKKAKINLPNDLDIIIGEANSKLFTEKGIPSDNTIKLFEILLEKDENNLLALLILGDNFVKENNLLYAKNLYLRLLKLLNKDSKEYTEIENKISYVEEKLNEN